MKKPTFFQVFTDDNEHVGNIWADDVDHDIEIGMYTFKLRGAFVAFIHAPLKVILI